PMFAASRPRRASYCRVPHPARRPALPRAARRAPPNSRLRARPRHHRVHRPLLRPLRPPRPATRRQSPQTPPSHSPLRARESAALLLSMTGHGEAHRHEDGLSIAVEIRTVNNRYFKLNLRMTEGYAPLESHVEG